MQVIQVRPSQIHGYGVFAITTIPAGYIIPRVQNSMLPTEVKLFGGYNHSCSPNARRDPRPSGSKYVQFLAVRNISPDEEITVDYLMGRQYGCNCPECRGNRVSRVPQSVPQAIEATRSCLQSGPKSRHELMSSVDSLFLHVSALRTLMKSGEVVRCNGLYALVSRDHTII